MTQASGAMTLQRSLQLTGPGTYQGKTLHSVSIRSSFWVLVRCALGGSGLLCNIARSASGARLLSLH
jgi:hypothetical protein